MSSVAPALRSRPAFALTEPVRRAIGVTGIAGLAFFGQITRRRGWVANPLVLSLYILSAMPTADAIALWLILDPHVIYPVFRGPGALADQHTAGVIMFGAGNILLVVGAAIAGRYLWDGRPGPSAVPTAPR